MRGSKISVIIIQYEPIWEKLKHTIDSVLMQKGCEFDIIFADDGSKENLFSKTIDYMDANKFSEYTLVNNEKNQGTVKNVISGLECSDAKYVRVIAPGDYLYNEYTLRNIVAYMDEHNAKEVFGKLAGYTTYPEGDLCRIDFPINPRAYLKNDAYSRKKQIKYLLAYGDNISGACYSWNREYYLQCLLRIKEYVKFTEDCVNILTLLDGVAIYHMDEYVTWYEMGTGISTSGESKWDKIIRNDWKQFFTYLINTYGKTVNIRRAILLNKVGEKKGLYGNIITNLLFLDRFVYRKYNSLTNQKQEEKIDDEFLRRIYGGEQCK